LSITRLTEEAEREKAQRWANAFKHTEIGELCTEESLAVLREAQSQGYTLAVENDETFSLTKTGFGISYLRSNADIVTSSGLGSF